MVVYFMVALAVGFLGLLCCFILVGVSVFGLDWGLVGDLCQVTWYKGKKNSGLALTGY